MSCPPSLPLAGPLLLPQPATSPAGAQVGAQSLHLSEALLWLPFPELGALGRGRGQAWREGNRELEGGLAGADNTGARNGSFWDSPNFKYSVQLSDHRPELVG